MWQFKAFGIAVALALLAEKQRSAKKPLTVVPKRLDPDSQRRAQRVRELWHRAFLVAREVAQSQTQVGVFAEAAYAAACASLSPNYAEEARRLEQAAEVVTGIHGSSATELARLVWNLRGCLADKQAWSKILGNWIEERLDSGSELIELGWSPATFGLNYWGEGGVSYWREGREWKLPQAFSTRDALEFVGPFRMPENAPQPPGDLSRLTICNGAQTAGLESPRLWALEGLLGAVPGVLTTELGHMHRQYPSARQPEWLESLTACYDPREVSHGTILRAFWEGLKGQQKLSYGQLIHAFYDQEQRQAATSAWEGWRSPDCPQLPPQLLQHEVTWFDPAQPARAKSALREIKILNNAFAGVDLTQSLLATKVNGFAAGFGTDFEVVMVAARYELDSESTTTLRLIRFLADRLE